MTRGTLPDVQAVKDAMQGRWLDFYAQYTELRPVGHELRGPCPLHGGDGPNFAVVPDTGEWYCHSQCQDGNDAPNFLMRHESLSFPDSLRRLADYAQMPRGAPHGPHTGTMIQIKPPLGPIAETYDYTDAAGTLLFQVTRHDPKAFRQRRPDPDTPGGWLPNLHGIELVLYRLPAVLAAVRPGHTVYVTEGEKDADALAALGLCATCNPLGAGKWRPAYTEALCRANVVILPDNDPPGRAHADLVAHALHGTAANVRVVALPGLPDKGDISDWLTAGGTPADLDALTQASPAFTPRSSPPLLAGEGGEERAGRGSGAPWPDPLAAEAFHGLAGEIVRAITPHTEADPAALLVQLLVAVGSALGPGPCFTIEDTPHHANLFAVVVGKSALARKGTAWGRVRAVMAQAAPQWSQDNTCSGLSSGEGLIHAVRDAEEKQEPVKEKGHITGYQTVITDPGVEDKRLLVIEGEFAGVLKQTERDGNTLSVVARNAWDGLTLQTLTKNRQRATDPHVSVIGHITADELRRYLSSTEAANGFANRFMWVCAQRARLLPFGGRPDPGPMAALCRRLADALAAAQDARELRRDADAIWERVYPHLPPETPGLLGSVITRAGAIVMRLALIYALLDTAPCIRPAHLTAALAVWEYAEASCRHIFGDSLGDPLADTLLGHLRAAGGSGLTRTQISQALSHHKDKGRVEAALSLLLTHARIRHEARADTGGRPADHYFAA